jgi:hypothetical protein
MEEVYNYVLDEFERMNRTIFQMLLRKSVEIFFAWRQMRLSTVVLAAIAVTTVADVCDDLVKALALEFPAGSYDKNGVCHGLFWKTQRGSGDICVFTTATKQTCPTVHKLFTAEAEVELRKRFGPKVNANTPKSSEVSQGTTNLPKAKPVVPTPPKQHQTEPEEQKQSDVVPKPLVPKNKKTESVRLTLADGVDDSVTFDILAFGDWGMVNRPKVLQPTAKVISERFSDVDAVFLLGDNFYPSGIRGGIDDPAFSLFTDILAPSTKAKFYPVLGNHDYLSNPDTQIQFSQMHAQWRMPARYYFKKFESHKLFVCAWFIDTEEFTTDQATWLDKSIKANAPGCHWLVVSGHKPVLDGGEYSPNDHLIKNLLPILTRYRVNLYLSGHEHQSQVLRSKNLPTTFLISGALGDMRGKAPRGHEYLEFINVKDVAILHLQFRSDHVDFEFVTTHKVSKDPLYSGVVKRV